MNAFFATGRLAADAETRFTSGGTAAASFKLANDVGYGDKKKTNWIRCTIWGKRAESGLIQYLRKGQSVVVTGELVLEEWTDKDGGKRLSAELRVAEIELAGKGQDSGGQGGYSAPPDDGQPVPF
jgi:single-strand DNA-binding protein